MNCPECQRPVEWDRTEELYVLIQEQFFLVALRATTCGGCSASFLDFESMKPVRP